MDEYQDSGEQRQGTGKRSRMRELREQVSAIRDIRRAVDQRSQTGHTGAIVDMLIGQAPTTLSYWREAALELHALGEHYDAWMAWKNAKLYSCRDGLDTYDAAMAGSELWAASKGGEDRFLGEKAACEMEAARDWDEALRMWQQLGLTTVELLDKIWMALADRGSPENRARGWPLDGECGWNPLCELTSWKDLAEAYLLVGKLPKAMDAFAMMVRADDSSTEDSALLQIIRTLIESARARGYADSEIIPGDT